MQNIRKKLKIAKIQKLVSIRKSFSTIIGGHALDLPAFKFMLTRCRSYPNKYVKTKKRNTLTSWINSVIIAMSFMTLTKAGFQNFPKIFKSDLVSDWRANENEGFFWKPEKVKCLQRRLGHIINCINTCTTTSCIHRCSNGYWLLIGQSKSQSEIEN